jgi:methyl-accepting chemotaxis protein
VVPGFVIVPVALSPQGAVMQLADLVGGFAHGAGFGVLLVLMLVMGVDAGQLQVRRVHGNVVELATNWLPSTQQLAGINESLNQMRRAELQMLLGGDAKALADEACPAGGAVAEAAAAAQGL